MKFLQNDNIAFLCENIVFMSNLQPGLSGALFLFSQKKKKAGAEDGLSCPNHFTYQTDSDAVS